jgi:hypothetical protein
LASQIADFIVDLRNCYSQLHLSIGFTHKYIVEIYIIIFIYYIIYFWRGIELFLVCLTVEKNAGMPENYMDGQ